MIVGRVWTALSLYADVLERLNPEGPWELSLALRGTANGLLGNVATGWKDFDGWWPDGAPTCPEPHLFIRREVEVWPDAEDTRALAYSFGDALENAWGMRQRRFLIHENHQGAGGFDPNVYR
jgi:hypothetical protein